MGSCGRSFSISQPILQLLRKTSKNNLNLIYLYLHGKYCPKKFINDNRVERQTIRCMTINKKCLMKISLPFETPARPTSSNKSVSKEEIEKFTSLNDNFSKRLPPQTSEKSPKPKKDKLSSDDSDEELDTNKKKRKKKKEQLR
ncbi:hypothetical protein RhiirC2_773944 [Rhizophagus irregularis]|uniref:Uncharacterized protein n=1 Tax=Rhizophagus irregularis TaxID=588596 RepID=A0A2N1NMP9_9GLOM|nr:hypothetical protein RhiirC2_773944 [Rhizophagus irregularis]